MPDDGQGPIPHLFYGIYLGSSEVGWRFAGVGRWATPVNLIDWATTDMDDSTFLETLQRLLQLLGMPDRLRFRAFNGGDSPRFMLTADAIHGQAEGAVSVGAHRLISDERRHRTDLTVAAQMMTSTGLTPTEKPSWLLCADPANSKATRASGETQRR